MIEVRDATPTDIPQLASLLGILFAQEHDFTPDRTAQTRGLAMILKTGGNARILVAERDGQIVGMVALHVLVSTALGARVGMLEDFIVAPQVRRSGIGRQLMAHLIEVARQDGLERITLLTDHDNSAAQEFYQYHGFTPSKMTPYRRLLARSLTV